MRSGAVDKLASSSTFETENDRIAETDRLQSPFLRLPAEIRNRIYNYTIDQGVHVYPTQFSKQPGNALHLLWLCRQIRAEAWLLFFSNTIFGFETRCKMDAFARSLITEQLQAIRSVKLLRHALIIRHDLSVFTSLERVCISSIYKTDKEIADLVRRRPHNVVLKLVFDHGNKV